MKEIMDLLSASPGNIKAADYMAGTINDCKAKIVVKLFDAISNGLDRANRLDCGFEKAVYEYFHKNKLYPTLAYHFAKVNAEVDIIMQVQIGDPWLYFGLVVVKDGKKAGWCVTAEEGERFGLVNNKNDKSEWSDKWEYLLDDEFNDRPKFRNHNDCFYNLFDEAYFNGFAERCAARINEMWEVWISEIRK
jgi:hypothetical protein